ncbi:hypothetical protein D3C87_231690 [compost metagenome]
MSLVLQLVSVHTFAFFCVSQYLMTKNRRDCRNKQLLKVFFSTHDGSFFNFLLLVLS